LLTSDDVLRSVIKVFYFFLFASKINNENGAGQWLSWFDLDAYVRLSCLSLDDLAAAGTASSSMMAADHSLLTGSVVDSAVDHRLPGNTPILHTIHSATEVERADEQAADSELDSDALAPSASPQQLDAPATSLPAIPEAFSPTASHCAASSSSSSSSSSTSSAASSSSVAAASSSSASSSPSVSSPPVDLGASVDLFDDRDVRFPSLANGSADRDAKLDVLAQKGYHNRIFAGTLLDMNKGDLQLTECNLKQFYAQR
jgi:hypothetical protein